MSEVDVIQADRDAAADLYLAGHLPDPCCPPPIVARKMRAGELDNGSYVQAFAQYRHRHRLTTAAQPSEDEQSPRLSDTDRAIQIGYQMDAEDGGYPVPQPSKDSIVATAQMLARRMGAEFLLHEQPSEDVERVAMAMYEAHPIASPMTGPQWSWNWLVENKWKLPDQYRDLASAAIAAHDRGDAIQIARELWWPHHPSRTRITALAELDQRSTGEITIEFEDVVNFVRYVAACDRGDVYEECARLVEEFGYYPPPPEQVGTERPEGVSVWGNSLDNRQSNQALIAAAIRARAALAPGGNGEKS